jgi:hypothetical protein
MNRRELLAALGTLPAATRVARVELQPSSVIVVEVPGYITCETAQRLSEQLARVFGDKQRIVVLDGGATLKVIDATEIERCR